MLIPVCCVRRPSGKIASVLRGGAGKCDLELVSLHATDPMTENKLGDFYLAYLLVSL